MKHSDIDININYRQKQFELNLDKTLAKKIEAAKRDVVVEYEFTNGGIVGTTDAATFELLKNAIVHYYGERSESTLSAHIIEDTDKRGMVVSKVIRVSKSNIYQYTLTLYFTKCRFLVNGKNVSIFVEQDMQNIHDVMNTVTLNGKAVDLKTINSLLQQQLLKVQEHLRTNNIHRQETTVPSINDKSIKSSDSKCIKCKRNVVTRGVMCTIGQHWVHYICDRLTKQEVENLEQKNHNETYNCKTCDNKGDTYSSKPCLQITEAINEQTIEKNNHYYQPRYSSQNLLGQLTTTTRRRTNINLPCLQ